jgi:hypothetical protein
MIGAPIPTSCTRCATPALGKRASAGRNSRSHLHSERWNARLRVSHLRVNGTAASGRLAAVKTRACTAHTRSDLAGPRISTARESMRSQFRSTAGGPPTLSRRTAACAANPSQPWQRRWCAGPAPQQPYSEGVSYRPPSIGGAA